MAEEPDTFERSPLDAVHRALGARMVPFGGWEMPLAYESGTIDEHLACRRDAVVFDVSHLGTVRVEGADADERLQWALTNDLTKIAPGRAQYTHLLDELDASVLDDIIVWWIDDEVFDVMPNASNTDRVRSAIGGTETTATRAVLAVQGPKAKERLAAVFPDAAAVGRFRVASLSWEGVPCTVAGTGYTGEAGVEIAVPAASAADLWAAIMDAGIEPAGLGRATHCAWRPRSRCTATSSVRGSPRCRQGSAGWWRGARTSSAVVSRSRPSVSAASAGSCAASPRTAAARRGPTARCASTTRSSVC